MPEPSKMMIMRLTATQKPKENKATTAKEIYTGI